MNTTNKLLMLLGAAFFLSSSCLKAQGAPYNNHQIIGKWVLKSASFNGKDVSVPDIEDRISFEFAVDGQVTFVYSNGKIEKGEFLIRENKLIDPNVPEYLDADIISLTKKGLVLAVVEDRARVVMRFELEDCKF